MSTTSVSHDTYRHISDLALEDQEQVQLQKLIEGQLDPETFRSVREWIRQCYHRPSDLAQVMLACNELLEGSGVETHGDCQLSYVNMGDMYITTVIRDHLKEIWFITTLGDVLESDRDRFG